MKIEIKVPAVGESITEATIGQWLKKNGETVQRDEEVLSLETDKASVEVVAEQAGQLEISVKEGETVQIGAVVGYIDTAKVAAASSTVSTAAPAAASAPAQPAAASASVASAHPDLKSHLPPAAQRVIAQNGLDPKSIDGTGKGGRITKEDAVLAAKSAATPQAPQISKTAASSSSSTLGATEAVPMSRLRKTIARNLKEIQNTAAILTTFNEVNMAPVMELRSKYKDAFKEKHGVGFGFMGIFCKAVVTALQEYPAVNGVIKGDDVIYHHYYNIGIAVGTEKGLIVPVVRNVDQLTLAGVEQAIRDYALKARDGKIGIDDLTGGTFTITNGGVYGSLMSAPILNPGQSGILGMHKIEDRPVVEKGQIVIRPMMYLALTYDHRIIDGKEAVGFLVRVKECLEDPARMLLHV